MVARFNPNSCAYFMAFNVTCEPWPNPKSLNERWIVKCHLKYTY